MAPHPEAQPHGAIREVHPDVFVVEGRLPMNPVVSIARTMTVVRQGGELTLINAMRLTPDGEAALERLGRPAHLLRIGANHGMDDAYLAERYKVPVWAPPGAKDRGAKVDHSLTEGCALPIDGASLFAFRNTRPDVPECAVVLARDGGVLVACDAVQNWTRETFATCSFMARPMLRLMGFGGAPQIGPIWKKFQEKAKGASLREDFERLAEQPFRHVLTAHGEPIRDTARDELAAIITRTFGPRT